MEANGQNGDVTRKPKPINPMLQNETMHNFSPMPMYAYNSPKNPVGVMPLKLSTGLKSFKNFKRLCEFSLFEWDYLNLLLVTCFKYTELLI